MIVAQGNLTDRPLPRTFAAIAARGFTGQLVIDPGGREHRIGWHGGAIVSAASPHPADSAAKIAVTLGVLSSTQAGEAARAIAANPGCDEVDIVARMARLPTDAVGRLARRLVAARAARIFSLQAGAFVLDDSPDLAAVPPVDPRWILYSGVRAHYTLDRLRAELAGWAAAIRLVDGADLDGFGFAEAEAAALARLHAGPLGVAPAPADLDPNVVEAMALTLLATGLAVPDASIAPPPTPEPVPPPTPEPAAPRRSQSLPAVELPRTITPTEAGAPRTVTPARTTTQRPVVQSRTRTTDPTRVQALIAQKRALVDGGADHYALLDLAIDAPVEAIRAAYFDLARFLHPDRLAAAGLSDDRREAHRVFARINEAFAVLSDPARRAEYAAVLEAGGAAAVAARSAQAEAQVRQVLGGEESYRKGESALRRMQLDDALAHFQKAVELSPEEADHHAMLGWTIYVAAPDKAAALPLARSHLRKATELSDKTALPHLLLGRIARMESDGETAVKHLRRALEIAPRNTDAAAELRAAESMRGRVNRPSSSLFSRLKKP